MPIGTDRLFDMLENLITGRLHDLDSGLRDIRHRQRNRLVTAIGNDDQLDIGLSGERVVDDVVIAGTGSGSLLCKGCAVSRPHQNRGFEEVIESCGASPTVMRDLQNVGLQRSGIIHVDNDLGCGI